MTISYNWLSEYLPIKIEVERLAKILTSIGLEVEGVEKYESVKGGLRGLVVGEVLSSERHPNADKLSVTTVNTGGPEALQIVCGAPNVAAGQRVVVAAVGTTIYPLKGEPVTMRLAKIRGIESQGMICAEDEIGLGESHAGILVLPAGLKPGTAVAAHFQPYQDQLIGIGLTPNHMDAMSHLGVARDVCAYLSHHENKDYRPRTPSINSFKAVPAAGSQPGGLQSGPIRVNIENTDACGRYSGLSMSSITVRESPQWLQDKLKAIGIRPISNIVDITNFVLHETGQPLHAFDADEIKGSRLIIKNLPEGTPFITLDEKERKLHADDLMICNAEEPMAMAGVFGGLHSGIKAGTTRIFLESAWFNPTAIRKTSFRHGLRTDAAVHFEKGMDISGTLTALKRAALLIKELAGGEVTTEPVDIYPYPQNKTQITIKHHYLKKLSGKNYHPDTVKNILLSLGFEILKEGMDDLRVAVPYHKPDVNLPADIVEEIMRIDGYDNIPIPATITLSPSVETDAAPAAFRGKTAGYLVGLGFYEIFTNSITNSAYYGEEELATTVTMINNLSVELNVMRPSMLETGLESIAHNLNRKKTDLRFFEFGKTYHTTGVGQYTETNHLFLYVTGQLAADSWKAKGAAADFYYLKGICKRLLELTGIDIPLVDTPLSGSRDLPGFSDPDPKAADAGATTGPKPADAKVAYMLTARAGEETLLEAGIVQAGTLKRFDIRQPVLFARFNWDGILAQAAKNKIVFRELPKQLPAQRDLAMVVDRSLPFGDVEKTIKRLRLDKLQEIRLFDIFESDKLGAGKKSLAVNFSFLDPEKTLTDKEIDGMVGRIMDALEKELKAEIRK
ncbi:MAG: phenylalanine--tRNA ligase subunit beta [Puia sp.]|nr:phenylalanine--tRNA ligase subunit beta [Puia sp.]